MSPTFLLPKINVFKIKVVSRPQRNIESSTRIRTGMIKMSKKNSFFKNHVIERKF